MKRKSIVCGHRKTYLLLCCCVVLTRFRWLCRTATSGPLPPPLHPSLCGSFPSLNKFPSLSSLLSSHLNIFPISVDHPDVSRPKLVQEIYALHELGEGLALGATDDQKTPSRASSTPWFAWRSDPRTFVSPWSVSVPGYRRSRCCRCCCSRRPDYSRICQFCLHCSFFRCWLPLLCYRYCCPSGRGSYTQCLSPLPWPTQCRQHHCCQYRRGPVQA